MKMECVNCKNNDFVQTAIQANGACAYACRHCGKLEWFLTEEALQALKGAAAPQTQESKAQEVKTQTQESKTQEVKAKAQEVKTQAQEVKAAVDFAAVEASGILPTVIQAEDVLLAPVKNGVEIKKYFAVEKTNIEIPETLNGKKVVSIGTRAFYNFNALTSVKLPTTLKTIGLEAFMCCRNLKSVEIPYGVTVIGGSAFGCCDSLKYVKLPDSVTSMDTYVFKNCKALEKIDMPSGVTEIPNHFFDGCVGLKEFRIPDSVKKVGVGAFERCTGLTKLTVPSGIVEFSYNCIALCASLHYNEYENGLYLGNEENPYLILVTTKNGVAFQQISTCKIHENTKMICEDAFYNCFQLRRVSIPASVEFIGDYAFHNCSLLTIFCQKKERKKSRLWKGYWHGGHPVVWE